MKITVIVISFILDSIMSNFVPLNSIFTPLFTIMALIIIFPYYNGDKSKYFGICFLTGLLYDLIYTDTIVIHGILFLLIGILVTRLNLILANNYLNVAFMAIISVIAYRFISYGLLLITANVSFTWFSLFKSIYSSLLLNVIYIVILYLITDKISRKLKIHKAN